jgi:hypothetical protein
MTSKLSFNFIYRRATLVWQLLTPLNTTRGEPLRSLSALLRCCPSYRNSDAMSLEPCFPISTLIWELRCGH